MSGPGRPAGLVAVGSVRSCAVTTTTLALGCAWPDPTGVLLVEADAAGGTLAATLGLAGQPGLVSLATAARRDTHPGLVAEHTQLLPCGVRVVVGPPSSEQARAAWGMLADPLELLSSTAGVVLVDCGRLDTGSPADGLFAAADVSLLVVRPQLPDLHALAGWLDAHRDRAGRLAVVLCGSGPYGAGEVADALGVEVLGALPWDAVAVSALDQVAGRRLRASAWWRAAIALAGQIIDRLPDGEREEAGPEPPEADTPGPAKPAGAPLDAPASDRMPAADVTPTGRVPGGSVEDGHPAGRTVGVR